MQKTMRAALMAAALVGVSLPAHAQTLWEDRAFVNLSFGLDTGTEEISRRSTFTVYNETGSVEASGEFGSFGIFDISVGARVINNFAVGFAYHTGDTTGSGSYSASVPHPLFFDRPRNVTGTFDDAKRDEHATHLMFGYMVPVGEKLDVLIFGGPSWFRVSQEMVTDVRFTEQGPPYTNITVLPAVETVKKSATGYNFGVDGTYFVYSTDLVRVGVGGFLRFTGATADLPFSGGTVETHLGGTQFGFGARIRF
jgi:hypothetical protein